MSPGVPSATARGLAPPPRPWGCQGTRRAAALALLALLLVTGLRGALGATFPVAREQVVLGTTSGIAGIQAEDGLAETMGEVDGAPDPPSYPATQAIGPGVAVSGSFPVNLQASDNLYLRYRESSTNPPASSTRTPGASGTPCQWANCNNGRTSNNAYATSSTNGEEATYGSFGFNLAAGSVILAVEVGYEAFEAAGGDDGMGVTVSWDGGTTYCSNAVTVIPPVADPNAYTYVNFTACTGHTWSQADFAGTTNSIYTKFSYVQVGGTPDTISLDANVVRVTYLPPGSYQVNVAYAFTGVPLGQDYLLTVEGAITDENINLQVLTPPSTWTTRATLNSPADQVLTYRPSPQEVVQGNLTVRLVDAGGPDATQSDFWIDQVRLVSTIVAYGLDVRQEIPGVVGASPLLLVKGNISAGGENFNVEIWNFTSGAWDPGLTAPFSATSWLFNVSLRPAEVGDGLVRIRFRDVDPNDVVAGHLTIDYVAVTVVPPAADGSLGWVLAAVGGGVAAALLFLFYFFWWRRSPEERPRFPPFGGRRTPGGPRPPSLQLKPGHAYLVEEEKPYQSLNILADLTRSGKPGLLITRKNPRNLGGDFNLGNTKTFWLAEAKAPEGSQILAPSLETVLYTIDRFLKANPEGVVLLDGIEFLVDNNNFNSVLRFLRRTVDLVSQMEQILLVSVGPDTLQQRELRNLEREMDVLRLA